MKITVQDGIFEAYVSRPVQVPAPVVIVLQEIFGVNADLRATCDELAAQGFIAIAPDLFWRDAPGLDLNAWSEDEWAIGLNLYQAYDYEKGVADVAATIEAARGIDGSNGLVGVMGFCLGGLMTFLVAARTDVDAAVAYYGGNTDQYLSEADGVISPMMMHLGAEDEFISKEAQSNIITALGGRPNVTIFSYPGCSHAFARHTGTHFDAKAAELANGRTVAFLRDSLTGS
ncbi:dienelactone hydrolase family protein [soil metagenome]